jgi:hypothetical protein
MHAHVSLAHVHACIYTYIHIHICTYTNTHSRQLQWRSWWSRRSVKPHHIPYNVRGSVLHGDKKYAYTRINNTHILVYNNTHILVCNNTRILVYNNTRILVYNNTHIPVLKILVYSYIIILIYSYVIILVYSYKTYSYTRIKKYSYTRINNTRILVQKYSYTRIFCRKCSETHRTRVYGWCMYKDEWVVYISKTSSPMLIIMVSKSYKKRLDHMPCVSEKYIWIQFT